MSTFGNPFRSTAEMVADGTVSRPAYLDVDGPSAAVAAAPPVAAAVDKQAAADQKKRLRSADRVGRLLHDARSVSE
jgi:hypothetical protein